jgi:gamma-glutamylcyclotransferase (GGCT)/AIG2-like uncharacterized protein YtfP
MKRRYYLAYGSNLNIRQMQLRCPRAKPVGKTLLEGYRLTFRGGNGRAVANIEPESGSSVPCALWLITAKDEAALDCYEGFPHLYRKETVAVDFGGRRMRVMAYIMNGGHDFGFPGPNYLKTIIDGYGDFGLDPAALCEALRTAAVADEPYGLSE